MKINLITIGTKMPAWVEQGYQEYAKRMPRECQLNLLELPLDKRSKTKSVEQMQLSEAKQILTTVNSQDYVIALDVKGKSLSTPQLASEIQRWQQLGTNVAIIVGGPDGLHQTCLDRADMTLSLSSLTFPHPLVRVILSEQLYRACMINQGHPYHK